jgi:hypothetical protein
VRCQYRWIGLIPLAPHHDNRGTTADDEICLAKCARS